MTPPNRPRAAVIPVLPHVPTDKDFGGKPSNGVTAIFGNDFYVRIAGTFKKVTLA